MIKVLTILMAIILVPAAAIAIIFTLICLFALYKGIREAAKQEIYSRKKRKERTKKIIEEMNQEVQE